MDIIAAARSSFQVPLGAYQVSGEFSMIMAATQKGCLDLERTILEILDEYPAGRSRFRFDVFCEEAAPLVG
jgi:porphobilinogen synthase